MRTDRNYNKPLTAAESVVLYWMAHGYSTQQIAEQIECSHHTVKFHIENIKGKLGVLSRVAIVIKALKTGLIFIDEIEIEEPTSA